MTFEEFVATKKTLRELPQWYVQKFKRSTADISAYQYSWRGVKYLIERGDSSYMFLTERTAVHCGDLNQVERLVYNVASRSPVMANGEDLEHD